MGKFLSKIYKYRFAYYFLVPTALGMFILHFLPLVQGLIMSFLNINQENVTRYLHAPFVGLKNYIVIFTNWDFLKNTGLLSALRNTLIYTVLVTFGTVVVGMIVALMLDRPFKGRSLFRTLFLFPWIVPTFVTGLLWGFMWQRKAGIINIILTQWLHIFKTEPAWLTGQNTLIAIIIPTIWRFWPLSMLLLLAGLQTIPEELYEAASIDGASGWQKFWKITWPMLKPVWAILILMGLISNTYSFNIVFMMFGHGAGYPGEWGDLMMTNIFRNSFQQWQFSFGAAISILLLLAMIGVVVVWYQFFKDSEIKI